MPKDFGLRRAIPGVDDDAVTELIVEYLKLMGIREEARSRLMLVEGES